MASEEHKKLASFIKGVHEGLRKESHAVGADEAWQKHCQQTTLLEEYAEKMRILATNFWSNNNSEDENLCRIHWVVKQSLEYFSKGGQDSAVEKEEKMSMKYFNKVVKPSKITTENNYKLRLLDVGSCYNPFSKFPIFDVTAVDLMPASDDVLKCDFMSVAIVKNTENIINPCYSLPENYFDVVVFSLLLEYFPCSTQRFKCCKNAYELLKPGGVLFILTPDSKHASANAKIMKSWRRSLASIGFWRVHYQKLQHLHCMMYRKCENREVTQHWLELEQCSEQPSEMMIIPQDFHVYCDNPTSEDVNIERSEEEDKCYADTFSFLPGSDIFS